MTEELALAWGLFALGTYACRVWSAIHSLEFKNDFAAAFALRGMCDGGFDFA
jgi:hypothetical protein